VAALIWLQQADYAACGNVRTLISEVYLKRPVGPIYQEGYHQWVYDRLSVATRGLKSQEEIRAVLEAELDAIEETGISGCWFTELALSE
jgi:hypothetical protein